MRKLLLKLIERLQKRLANKKDDLRDLEHIKEGLQELDCKGKVMTKYTLPRLEEAIGQLEALQKGIDDMSQYSWIGEILYDLRIVADEIKEEKKYGHRD